MDRPDLKNRCGSCARFINVVEIFDQNGEVRRRGDCLLGVWPSPLYENNTCSSYVHVDDMRSGKHRPPPRRAAMPRGHVSRSDDAPSLPPRRRDFEIPEELLDMDKEEFKEILRDVIRDELGLAEVKMAGRFVGGEIIIKPGKEGTQDKHIPLDSFFHKIVMVRDKLRVLEQKVNAHPQLSADEKVQMQQYITACYGSLTTFNVLFAERSDNFIGQKGDD
ncbi:MAG: hypothetical protein U0235_20770 [Polyangiaceae bacterium]